LIGGRHVHTAGTGSTGGGDWWRGGGAALLVAMVAGVSAQGPSPGRGGRGGPGVFGGPGGSRGGALGGSFRGLSSLTDAQREQLRTLAEQRREELTTLARQLRMPGAPWRPRPRPDRWTRARPPSWRGDERAGAGTGPCAGRGLCHPDPRAAGRSSQAAGPDAPVASGAARRPWRAGGPCRRGRAVARRTHRGPCGFVTGLRFHPWGRLPALNDAGRRHGPADPNRRPTVPAGPAELLDTERPIGTSSSPMAR